MAAESQTQEYQVLARKYRPGQLSELIGQDVLVQTLTHAIEKNRIPHAFIMTGIRGVGKTSTARIIARSLVCSGEDGTRDKPTITPCGVCEQCKAIAEDRHVDVLEVDAASRTGVNDIREIIDTIRYAPVMARYKIYIIDEVHMLSKSAFNALLKTLEEPPAHVKFIFATTEIRKIPVTILSRCMRFDLPRIDIDLLSGYLRNIAEREGAILDSSAAVIIAQAAEGSVRDALSLLDQAIGSSPEEEVSSAHVQQMLGAVDKEKTCDLFEHIVNGRTKEAITTLRQLYSCGAEPVTLLQDLLDITHSLTRMKMIPELDDVPLPENLAKRYNSLTGSLSFPVLARLWQMVVKGLTEIKLAPNALIAAEMIIIRIVYASRLPAPSDIIEQLKQQEPTSSQPTIAPSPELSAAPSPVVPAPSAEITENAPAAEVPLASSPESFEALVALFNARNEAFLCQWLQSANIVNFEAESRQLTLKKEISTPRDTLSNIRRLLKEWTGQAWTVEEVAVDNAEKSLHQQQEELLAEEKQAAVNDKVVQKILQTFPDAHVTDVSVLEEEV